jgi:Uma2 family endonuclease
MSTLAKATIEDLYHAPEKAELVNGEVVIMSSTGGKPGRAATKIVISLSHYEDEFGGGCVIGDNVGFIVELPNRSSFSPDAAWYVGKVDTMKFLEGAPVFAVEVRSENDYGAKAERDMKAKRDDYFAAGTLVVWDVDLLSDEVVRVYRTDNPDYPTIYGRGETADAEPAVPGWTMSVDDLFK